MGLEQSSTIQLSWGLVMTTFLDLFFFVYPLPRCVCKKKVGIHGVSPESMAAGVYLGIILLLLPNTFYSSLGRNL